MTTPKINTIQRGGSRFYVSPETGEKSPGVTSVLGMLPKDFLTFWSAKMVAEEAVNNLGSVVGIAMNNPAAAIDYLKNAPRRNTQAAADIGTAAHDIFERLARGERVPRQSDELQVFADHFREYLDVVQPTYNYMEETVWSMKHDYAGSFDAHVTIDGVDYWMDNKTTRSGIHEEVGIQLSAYGQSDVIMQPDGTTIPTPPASTTGLVLHVRPEGWQLVPVEAGPEQFEEFLRLRGTFAYERDIKPHVIGQPIASGPSTSTLKKPVKRRVPRAAKPTAPAAPEVAA